MAIKIQQYNGNNYNYLPPTYASSSTQAENSDKLDGYHATDFLKENQLGSIQTINGYINNLRTITFKKTVINYDGNADLNNAGFPVPTGSPSFVAICTKESNIKLEGIVGAVALLNNYLTNISMEFYIEKSWDSRNETVSFTVTDSPIFVITSNANIKPEEGTWLDWNAQCYKFSTPRTYTSEYIRGLFVLTLNNNRAPYSVDMLEHRGKLNEVTTATYSFTQDQINSIDTWINTTQFYYKSVYLPSFVAG